MPAIPTIFVDAARARPQGHRAAGRHQRRRGAAGARRGGARAWRRRDGAAARRRRKRPRSARTRPSSPSSPSPPATPPRTASAVDAGSIDLLARIFSMGVLHHAMTGTGAVAIAAAAAIPGTIVHRVAPAGADGRVRFGHPSGTLSVGAEAREDGGQWAVKKVMMSRSARRLMEGWVRVPARPEGGRERKCWFVCPLSSSALVGAVRGAARWPPTTRARGGRLDRARLQVPHRRGDARAAPRLHDRRRANRRAGAGAARHDRLGAPAC